MIERKVCTPAEAKLQLLDDDGNGRLQGYASTFANFDRVKERVVKGAFARTLEQFKRDGFIALDHDWTKRVAFLDDAYEDDYGLWIDAPFHSTDDSQRERIKARERIAAGKSVSLSIGYEVLDDEHTKDGRLLKELNLYEVSLVSVPANPLAVVTGAKANGDLLAGLPMDAHAETVLAAVKDYIERVKDLQDLRRKEGRMLSGMNRDKLRTMHGSLSDMLAMLEEMMAASEPKANPDTVRQAIAQMYAMHGRGLNM